MITRGRTRKLSLGSSYFEEARGPGRGEGDEGQGGIQGNTRTRRRRRRGGTKVVIATSQEKERKSRGAMTTRKGNV